MSTEGERVRNPIAKGLGDAIRNEGCVSIAIIAFLVYLIAEGLFLMLTRIFADCP